MRGQRARWGQLFAKTMLQCKPGDRWTLLWDEDSVSLGHPWKQYKERAGGRFHCWTCNRSWNSVHVSILFHMALQKRSGQGVVRGRIFKQACYRCPSGAYLEPELEEEHISITLYNLRIMILQECYGECVDDLLMAIILDHWQPGSHQSEHCEACHLGICNWKPHRKDWKPQRKMESGNQHPMHPAAKALPWHNSEERGQQVIIAIPESSSVQPKQNSDWECCKPCFCGLFCFLLIVALAVIFFKYLLAGIFHS